MKTKYIILTVWVLGLGYFSSWVTQDMDNKSFLQCFFTLGFIWMLLVGILNLFLTVFNAPIKIQDFTKFRGRKSPIYEILDFGDSYYTIKKYELQYTQKESSMWLIIPFMSLVSNYEYEISGRMSFFIDDVETIPNIGEFYEETKAAEKRIEERRKRPLIELNKEFNDNYI